MPDITDPPKLYGFYRAKVVNNKDPNMFGRIKVWIPDFCIDIPETEGLWARPANNPLGGRNTDMKDPNLQTYGCLYIPEKDSWVWIFFEGGNLNRPYYWGALDIENTKVPPENQQGDDYQNKWTIIRTKQGRVIIASDDKNDERVEITGKKQNNSDVYTIDNNQKTIFIDDRSESEKILIKDQEGNYINIDTHNKKIHIYSDNNINKKTNNDINNICKNKQEQISGSYSITVSGFAAISADSISFKAGSTVVIKAGSGIYLQAPKISKSIGSGPAPTNPASVSDNPKGDRD